MCIHWILAYFSVQFEQKSVPISSERTLVPNLTILQGHIFYQSINSIKILGVLKKHRRLINNRTIVFRSIFKISFALNKAYLKVDFETKTVEIC